MAETTWHPLLNLHEIAVGVWEIRGQFETWGSVRIVRRGPEVGYRADVASPDGPRLVGYYRTLRAAARAGYDAYVRSRQPGYHWGHH